MCTYDFLTYIAPPLPATLSWRGRVGERERERERGEGETHTQRERERREREGEIDR